MASALAALSSCLLSCLCLQREVRIIDEEERAEGSHPELERVFSRQCLLHTVAWTPRQCKGSSLHASIYFVILSLLLVVSEMGSRGARALLSPVVNTRTLGHLHKITVCLLGVSPFLKIYLFT